MDQQYISRIKIKNYKSFTDFNEGNGIELAIPDHDTPGSGLTVLIGENSSGKTSIASALTKLKKDSRIYDHEKNKNRDVELIFEDISGGRLLIANSPGGNKIVRTEEGFNLSYQFLDVVKDNRIWSSNFSSAENYGYDMMLQQTQFRRSVIEANTARRLAAIDESEPEKKRQINEILYKIAPDFKSWEIKADERSSDYIAYELVDGTKLDIDVSLGSGVLNLFRIALAIVESRPIIFIDEPEAFLYPIAQINLSEVLSAVAQDRQIIISTHSPYMFKSTISGAAKLHVFTRYNGETNSKDSKELGWGIFGESSPTWGEINYFAYNLPSIEFHNELYGFLQARAITEDDKNYFEENFDHYLKNKVGASVTMKTWVRILKERDSSGAQKNEPKLRTLQTYIRNSIHHPENTLNVAFTPEELSRSTTELVEAVKKASTIVGV